MNLKLNVETQMPELWEKVAEMLGINNNDFLGGIERCEFPLEKLTAALALGFITPDYKFNNSPTVKTFYEFGKRAEEYGATVEFIGYLESKYRNDARLIVDGVEITAFSDSASLILDFSQTFHDADEFTANSELLRAWYD